jgi:hypothetical protein
MTSRVIDIEADEMATIMVRSEHHVTLVFGRMSLDVFERDGMLYTRQGVKDVVVEDSVVDDDGDTQPVPGDTQLETQPWDYEYTTPEDTQEVISFAGGTFEQVNERHASRLEMDDMLTCMYTIKEELSFGGCDEGGDTQLDGCGGETQLDGCGGDTELIDYGSDTDSDDSHTRPHGIYKPRYLRR